LRETKDPHQIKVQTKCSAFVLASSFKPSQFPFHGLPLKMIISA
jgi:hypothetical protein